MAFFINCPSIIMESRPPNLPYFLFLFWYFFFFINSINKTAKTQCLCLPRPVKCFQTNSLYVQITHIDHSFDLDHSPSFSPHFSKYEKTKTSVVFVFFSARSGNLHNTEPRVPSGVIHIWQTPTQNTTADRGN